MKLSSKFMAAASLMVTSALSSGVQAQDAVTTAGLSDVQSKLNLSQNTFYHPGAGVRIDEVCEAKGDAVQCDMTFINGGHNRVQKAIVTYGTDASGQLTDMSAQSRTAEFYTANGTSKAKGVETNTATSGKYDELMSAASRPDLDAKLSEAKAAGAKTPSDYIINRIGNSDSYFTAGKGMTAIETAVADAGVFAYDGKYRPLDRLVRLNDLGHNAVSEVGCILIPPADVQKPTYDADISDSARMLCVEKNYLKGPMKNNPELSNEFKRYGMVETTYSIYALGHEETLVGTSIIDQKVFGATALGASSDHDQDGYDATAHGLINPQGVRETTGNRIRPTL